MNSHSGVFSKIETLLALSVSYFALDSGKSKMELVKEEALSICNPIRWSGVLCVLDLSSVFFVHCFYKSYEAMLKYKIMFNELIKPRKCPSFNSNTVYFLFCSNSIIPSTPFRHNHYVPFIFCSEKNKVNMKRKLVTSQKCKESKKRATYSVHHFWKENLFPNNSLLNFADNLNVHKSPSVSKSSTFNIIADNFSSLDNNFLTALSNLLFLNLPILIHFISISTSVNKSLPRNVTVSSRKVKYYLASLTGV